MPVTLIATLSGVDSNSLVDVSVADAYFDSDVNCEQWCSMDVDGKARALIRATRLFEELDFWGEPAMNSQALPFPRVFFPSSDGLSIPREIVQACCEQALTIAVAVESGQSGENRRFQMQAQGVTSYRLGDMSETFGNLSGATSTTGNLAQFSGRVQRLLSKWLRTAYQFDSGRYPAPGQGRDSNGLSWPSELS